MYNEQQKLDYLKTVENPMSKQFLTLRFEEVAPLEQNLGKDLSRFTVPEALDYYKYVHTRSIDVLNNVASQFGLYTDWCKEHGYIQSAENPYRISTGDLIVSCIDYSQYKGSILSREEILRYIRETPNPADKFVMLALYEGLKGKNFREIALARLSQIDEEEKTITTVDDRVIPISDELIFIAHDAANTYERIRLNSFNDAVIPLRDRMYSDEIVKVQIAKNIVSGDEYREGRRIYNRMLKLMTFMGMPSTITLNSLNESGRIAMINRSLEPTGYTFKDFMGFGATDKRKKLISWDVFPKPNSYVTYYEKYKEYLK